MYIGATALKMEQNQETRDPREVEKLKNLVQLQGDEIRKLKQEIKKLLEHLEMVSDKGRAQN